MSFQSALSSSVHSIQAASNEYRGLSPFLRASIAGEDLRPMAQAWLDQSQQRHHDPIWLMNLSLVLQCLSHKELGLEFHEQALQHTRVFAIQPKRTAKLTLLCLLFPGDIASNTPIECLLENESISIIQYFLCPSELFVESIPEHDICFVAFSENPQLTSAVQRLAEILADWPKPVINRVQYIQNTHRSTTGRMLKNVRGLQASQARELSAMEINRIAQGDQSDQHNSANLSFPIIVRPQGSHAGVGLERINNCEELQNYLRLNPHGSYSVAPFIDYSSSDSYYRKFRLAIIDGRPYACHMGISKDWMIHYVNAGMYEDAWKRTQEAAFFDNFDQFARRHSLALREIYHRIGLDYFCIDCAETKSGDLLVFEVDHCMVVHDMDLPALFPYKSKQMAQVRDAFVEYLNYTHRQSSGSRIERNQTRLLNAQNFSGGPGVMPDCVLEQLSAAIERVPGLGISLLGVSHRSDWFQQLVMELEQDILSLLDLDESYRTLFLQGGATQQFSMIPMTLLDSADRYAEYLHCGYWSGKSIEEATRIGNVQVIWSGESERYCRLPARDELNCTSAAAYLHYVSNETVEGLQFHEVLGNEGVPLVCDMSSDFLSRPVDASKYSIIYAHAQKNLGPAGVTIVVLRREILERVPELLPSCLNYRVQAQHHSIYNTPPVMAIYAVHLVVKWLIEQVQGLAAMDALNQRKAQLLYTAIDNSQGLFKSRVRAENRSLMNVPFALPTVELEKLFLRRAESAGFIGLNGHRSLGGIRASLYNGMSISAVENLVGFLDEFQTMCRRSGLWLPASQSSKKNAA